MTYPWQEEAKAWLTSILKPFLLSLLKEPRYDYSSLIEEDKEQLARIESGEDIEHLSKDALLKKFDIRLKQLLYCISQSKLSQAPSGVLDHLRTLIRNPNTEELTLYETNRISINPNTGMLE